MRIRSKKSVLNSYQEALKKAFVDIAKLQEKLLKLNTKPHGYLNTLCNELLSLIFFYKLILDEKNPFYNQKSIDERWFVDQMQMMHRVFLSSLHIATECGLKAIIEDQKLKVEISRNKQIKSALKLISDKESNLYKKVNKLQQDEPSFKDYLEAVLKSTQLSKDYKQLSRNYFSALSIIRNKISHGYCDGASFQDGQIETIKNANLGKVVDKENKLQFSPYFYKPILNNVGHFFEEIYKKQ